MADFEENVEEIVGTTREAAAVAIESGGDETATRPRMRPAVPGTRPVATAGDETMATRRVMYIRTKGSYNLMRTRWQRLKGSV